MAAGPTVMTPLQFETRHVDDWNALEEEVRRYQQGGRKRRQPLPDG